MCGRYSITKAEEILDRFHIHQTELKLIPRFNVAPAQQVLVVINDRINKLVMMRLGLIPFWAKDMAIGNRMINARAETLDEKPSFRESLRKRRCLIPADGFYEWKKSGQEKTPYRITLKEGGLFALAGLWDTWTSPQGEIIHSCTIITTTPNKLMNPIHDRMPVILPLELENYWLDPEVTEAEALIQVLKPYPEQLMEAYQVSTLVNSPKNDIPQCILPLVQGELFGEE